MYCPLPELVTHSPSLWGYLLKKPDRKSLIPPDIQCPSHHTYHLSWLYINNDIAPATHIREVSAQRFVFCCCHKWSIGFFVCLFSSPFCASRVSYSTVFPALIKLVHMLKDACLCLKAVGHVVWIAPSVLFEVPSLGINTEHVPVWHCHFWSWIWCFWETKNLSSGKINVYVELTEWIIPSLTKQRFNIFLSYKISCIDATFKWNTVDWKILSKAFHFGRQPQVCFYTDMTKDAFHYEENGGKESSSHSEISPWYSCSWDTRCWKANSYFLFKQTAVIVFFRLLSKTKRNLTSVLSWFSPHVLYLKVPLRDKICLTN